MDTENRWGMRIGHLKARRPIIQGGMGVGISLSGLASAVANEGGVGVIATAGIGVNEPDFKNHFKAANRRALIREIRRARKMTPGIIGVNVMLALSNSEDLIDTAVDEGVDIVFLSAGLPLRIPDSLSLEKLRNARTRFIPIVSSPRAARVIFRAWEKYQRAPDALVIEGPMAGGHLGFKREEIDNPAFSLDRLLHDVRYTIRPYEEKKGERISIIVAGGVYTGADIFTYLQRGAQGVQMATRFVATHECDADRRFKEAYIQCEPENLTIIDSPVGLPGRAIRNAFLVDVARGLKKPFKCPFKCLRTCRYTEVSYCIAKALTQAKMGDLESGFTFAGANAYRVDRILSVKELMVELEEEYWKSEREEQYADSLHDRFAVNG